MTNLVQPDEDWPKSQSVLERFIGRKYTESIGI